MSYRAGCQGFSAFGTPDRQPAIVCDADDCGASHEFTRPTRPKWYYDGKPVPGWTHLTRGDAESRVRFLDYCPDHAHLMPSVGAERRGA